MASEPLSERLKRLPKLPEFWVFLVPLVYYAACTRFDITFGDGPELLVAAYKLGISHPSGYPLWTLLGFLPAHFPLGTPYWNVAVTLSALPSAVAVWAMFKTLRHLGVSLFVGIVCVVVWGLNYHVAYQSTRIEVYALHCALLALAFYALVRFMMPRPLPQGGAAPSEEAPPERDVRWAFAAVAFTCLALTNHLTSVFMVVPVLFGMLSADHRRILRPKPIAIMFGIAIACASIYVYLPLSAMANVGDRVTWNDPQTLERFWFHVTGKEYSIFRRYDKILPTLEQFWGSLNISFFPGIVVVIAIGIYDWLLKHWKSLVCLLVFELSYLGYVGTYPIKDVSTYYTALFIPVILMFAVGLDWLLRMRFRPAHNDEPSRLEGALQFVVMAALCAWIVGLATYSFANRYREAVASDMSATAIAQMEDPAIVFTSVDGHTFPMWYQVYVEHPDRKVVVVDTVMFHLKNKQWYRDSLRKFYPWIEWPPDEIALGSGWRQWIVDKNPDINIYAFLDRRWPSNQSYPVLQGWHHQIIDGRRDTKRASTKVKHAYVARAIQLNGRTYFHDATDTYESGDEKIACVVEWWKSPEFNAAWRFYGPDGSLVREFPRHAIPADSNQSWEYLQPEEQKPGAWRCEIEAPGEPLIVQKFVLE